MGNNEITYRSLMKVESLNGLSNQKALSHIGHLIDAAFDVKQIDGLQRAFSLAEELRTRKLTAQQSIILHYFLGNAWSNLSSLTRAGTDASWSWEQEEIEHEIIHFRQALNNEAFSKLQKYRRCQILTNLGNLLNQVGRFVEALEYWDKALNIAPTFGMALGNKGIGLSEYAYAIHHRHDSILFIERASENLKAALSSPIVHEGAKKFFMERQTWVESLQNRNRAAKHKFKKYRSLGSNKIEVNYRRWCLENRLFLNHLNDLGQSVDAARDNIILPPITKPVGEGLHYEGLYNQLKQEFVSARYLYFEGIKSEKVHFSDKHVVLYNTWDYPSYSLAVEKVKAAYRIAYSIFDKAAFFLNRYLKLLIKETQVTFRTFWYNSQKKDRGLRTEFLDRKNWPLRGLFWLSKDLYEDNPGFRQAIEPEAQELKEIRNHIEHKYLKVHEFGRPAILDEDSFADRMAFSVDRGELEAKTLRILKMARAALIYLAVAVNWEERERRKERDSNKEVLEIRLDTFEDEWKI